MLIFLQCDLNRILIEKRGKKENKEERMKVKEKEKKKLFLIIVSRLVEKTVF